MVKSGLILLSQPLFKDNPWPASCKTDFEAVIQKYTYLDFRPEVV